jgi:nitrite reductase (NO-forming)
MLAATVVAVYLIAAGTVVAAHGLFAAPQWLALHLVLLGAATNAVFVWSRHFAQALLHVRPDSERPAQLRLLILNIGVISVLIGMSVPWAPFAVAGAGVVVAAVAAHTISLVSMARSALLSGQLRVAVRYYVAAGLALTVGGSLGGLLASGTVHSDELATAIRLAHVHLNVFGWLGLTVIGTQFTLWPAVLRTRMAESTPETARRVLSILVGGLVTAAVALLAGPYVPGAHWLAAGAMAVFTGGVRLALVPAVREMRVKPPRSAAAWALLAGNCWLLAALVVDVVGLAQGADNTDRLLDRPLIPMLGIGVVVQTLIGALCFLLPVTVGGGPAGNRRMTTVLERGWQLRGVLGNLGVLTLAVPVGGLGRSAAWAAVLIGFGTFPLLVAAAFSKTVTSRRP